MNSLILAVLRSSEGSDGPSLKIVQLVTDDVVAARRPRCRRVLDPGQGLGADPAGPANPGSAAE